MPRGRKRRAEAPESAAEEPSEDEGPRNTQRRRQNNPAESEEENYSQNDADEPTVLNEDAEPVGGTQNGRGSGLAMKLVRYALACEFGRAPIRREGIKEKVFGKHSGRGFQQIFDEAQDHLMEKFGMQLVELPLKEKVTLRDRRAAAQKASSAPTPTNRTYVLKSILPPKYNIPAIITPSHISSTAAESAYIGLYTLIVSVIMLAGGTVSDEKLMRYLQRLNANVNTPVDKTEALLAKMQKQGYVVKIKDNSSGDDITEWMVGPRGKIEIGTDGVKGLVETVYGDTAPDDLEARLRVSLGIQGDIEAEESQNDEPVREAPARRGRGRPRRVEDGEE